MVSVILGLKWPCINDLDKTLINEEFYIVITAGNERKTVLLSMWQLFLLPGKDNFHQITLLSPPFTLMQSVAVHCFCSFLPCGRIINRTFLIFFLLSISIPQHIYETFFSSIPRKKITSACCHGLFKWYTSFEHNGNVSEMIASENMTIGSLVILAYR